LLPGVGGLLRVRRVALRRREGGQRPVRPAAGLGLVLAVPFVPVFVLVLVASAHDLVRVGHGQAAAGGAGAVERLGVRQGDGGEGVAADGDRQGVLAGAEGGGARALGPEIVGLAGGDDAVRQGQGRAAGATAGGADQLGLVGVVQRQGRGQ